MKAETEKNSERDGSRGSSDDQVRGFRIRVIINGEPVKLFKQGIASDPGAGDLVHPLCGPPGW